MSALEPRSGHDAYGQTLLTDHHSLAKMANFGFMHTAGDVPPLSGGPGRIRTCNQGIMSPLH